MLSEISKKLKELKEMQIAVLDCELRLNTPLDKTLTTRALSQLDSSVGGYEPPQVTLDDKNNQLSIDWKSKELLSFRLIVKNQQRLNILYAVTDSDIEGKEESIMQVLGKISEAFELRPIHIAQCKFQFISVEQGDRNLNSNILNTYFDSKVLGRLFNDEQLSSASITMRGLINDSLFADVQIMADVEDSDVLRKEFKEKSIIAAVTISFDSPFPGTKSIADVYKYCFQYSNEFLLERYIPCFLKPLDSNLASEEKVSR